MHPKNLEYSDSKQVNLEANLIIKKTIDIAYQGILVHSLSMGEIFQD